MSDCKLCTNNNNGECTLDWGCCFIPDPYKLEYLKTLGEIFGDD
jgi:hypothetical protein